MRRLWVMVARWIDSEQVRHYQHVVYVAYIGAGIHAIVMNPPGAVTRVMGERIDAIWTGMLIVCPLLAFAGMRWARTDLRGLWLQLAGDAGFFFTTWAYVAAIVQATYARSATFSAWLGAAIGVCAAGVVIRDLRLLRRVTARMHQLDYEGDCR